MIKPHFTVHLGARSHPVYVGQNLLASAEVWPQGAGRKALICLDSGLTHLQDSLVQSLQSAGWDVACELLKGSESLKDFQTLFPLYGKFLELGLQKRSLLVAVGGGTIGDAVGFLAASYLRGIPWVSVPTTLLAQVDSGLGGKTGVNHPAGKNLIGAIWQPSAIVCDTSLLDGLSLRDRVSGLGEMLKYGLIADKNLWQWLNQQREGILAGQNGLLDQAIGDSLRIKARYVEADEPDLSGVRAALNFGHTFGHALEAVSGYGAFRHGEAVIWGMRVAAYASHLHGWLSEDEAAEIEAALSALPLPPLPALSPEALLTALAKDKKSEGQTVATLLLRSIGQVDTFPVPLTEWREWIRDFMALHPPSP